MTNSPSADQIAQLFHQGRGILNLVAGLTVLVRVAELSCPKPAIAEAASGRCAGAHLPAIVGGWTPAPSRGESDTLWLSKEALTSDALIVLVAVFAVQGPLVFEIAAVFVLSDIDESCPCP